MHKFIFISFFCALTSTSLFAKEEILSTTDNDDNKEVYNLVVSVDESTQRLKELFKDTFVDGNKIKREMLDPEGLTDPEGVILEKRGNYNVLNLKSDNFDYERGGRIVIDTLYNGISGERRFFDLDLARDKNHWRLFKHQKSVSRFHVKVNKIIIFGTVGIKSIFME